MKTLKVTGCIMALALAATAAALAADEKAPGAKREKAATAKPNLAEYNLPYRATKDTEWISNPSGPNPKKGPVKKGTLVHLNRKPNPIGASWMDAKFADGSIKFIHPGDFEPAP